MFGFAAMFETRSDPKKGVLALEHNVAAVVVTYNPDLVSLRRLLSSLRGQVRQVHLIDNGSDAPIGNLLLAGEDEFVCLTCLEDNQGIASAQNIGITKAFDGDSDCVVFFDQDSSVPPGFVTSLVGQLEVASIVAPVFFDAERKFGYPLVDIRPCGRRTKYRPEELSEPIDISIAISSGTLVKRCVFDRVGMMDERLFIDYVDTEWCLRCAKEGFRIRVEPRARMLHSIGEKSRRVFGFTIPIHSPVRRYYRVRNALLLRQYPHVPRRMIVHEILSGFVHQLLIIVLEPNRSSYLRLYFQAVRDGLKGRAGRYVAPREGLV